jgi:hypothetical protein
MHFGVVRQIGPPWPRGVHLIVMDDEEPGSWEGLCLAMSRGSCNVSNVSVVMGLWVTRHVSCMSEGCCINGSDPTALFRVFEKPGQNVPERFHQQGWAQTLEVK